MPPSNDIPLSLKADAGGRSAACRIASFAAVCSRAGGASGWSSAPLICCCARLAGIVLLDPSWPLALRGAIGGGARRSATWSTSSTASSTRRPITTSCRDAAERSPSRTDDGLDVRVEHRSLSTDHWQHHRALGTTMDSENWYFDALRIGYSSRVSTGHELLRTLRGYRDTEVGDDGGGGAARGRSGFVWLVIDGAGQPRLVARSDAVRLTGCCRSPGSAACSSSSRSWSSLRTAARASLEEADATSTTDLEMTTAPSTACSAQGPLANTVGSAGFNRHAIHHWEPQLSYTRLADVEAYLLRTEVARWFASDRQLRADLPAPARALTTAGRLRRLPRLRGSELTELWATQPTPSTEPPPSVSRICSAGTANASRSIRSGRQIGEIYPPSYYS